MGIMISPEDKLIAAMSAKQAQIRLQNCAGGLPHIVKGALRKEPRLVALLKSYEYSYQKTRMIQILYTYDVTLEYQENSPDDLSNVEVDSGAWDANSLLENGAPRETVIVTQNPKDIGLGGIMSKLLSKYEGIHGWNVSSSSFEKVSDYTVCNISYAYLLPLQQLRQLQGKAAFAAKNIWKKILGKASVPQFVKPFLAFSYLTQNVAYDKRAYDEVESDVSRLPTDPIPHLAYGPLVENRGICGGFAWAFQTLMAAVGVECICVFGYLKEKQTVGHFWNLVKIDGQYYHVDATSGRTDDGMNVNYLMQPDSMMKASHIWDIENYPSAKGLQFSYDFIEDYLVENGTGFLDAGAAEAIFFPDAIID